MSRIIRREGSGMFGLGAIPVDNTPLYTDLRDPNAKPGGPVNPNALDLTTREVGEALFEGCGEQRIAKGQIYCRKCRREVEKTEQSRLFCGRTIVCCAFYCHGDAGSIKICSDQLSAWMTFEVFEGEPSLRAPKRKEIPALPVRQGEGACIEIEAEVIPIETKALT